MTPAATPAHDLDRTAPPAAPMATPTVRNAKKTTREHERHQHPAS